MQKYELTKAEVKAAITHAKKLIAAGKRGTYTNYLIGTLGEMGYAKHINSKVNLEVYARGVGDKGADFTNVQVKTVTWPHSNKQLKVSARDSSLKNDNVKKFVLMHVDIKNKDIAYLVGEISKESFVKKAKFNPHYESYTVEEHELDTLF